MRSRRLIPSLSQLLAFEAVFRAGSVTGAAREINLTQSTVSRLVQSLETQLGCRLFLRSRKRLVATDAAAAYYEQVVGALDKLHAASMSLIASPEGGSLSLAVLPAFGVRWLAPRLGRFLHLNPGITLSLATRLRRFDLEAEGFDAMIYFGNADWQGMEHLKLFDEHLTACAAPDFLKGRDIGCAADVAQLPLLQLVTRETAWAAWFKGQGEPAPNVAGMRMDQFSMMIQTAISGLGVALLPDYLARTEIEEGRLVPLLTPSVPGTGSYWLAWPSSRRNHGPILALRKWLSEQVDGQGSDPESG